MKRYWPLLMLLLLVVGCAGTETRSNEDHSSRQYDIQAQNNYGTITLYLAKDETRTAESTSEGGEASPDFDLAAAIADGGSTTSLATEGADLALKGVSSMYEYLKKRWENGQPPTDPDNPSVDPIPPPDGLYTETLLYWGRHNGDRATWYGERDFSGYPQNFIVTVEGCTQFSVNEHNGERLVHDNYILKQSDVSGRGLALVAPASCKATEATISYLR